MNGFFNLDKPVGISSAEAVRRIKKELGKVKVGHAGTLDPSASGVLPILVGKATRLSDEFLGYQKKYLAQVTFGVITDSYDAEGNVLQKTPVGDLPELSQGEIAGSLRSLIESQTISASPTAQPGTIISQTPPPYSAIKTNGVRAYKLARENKSVDLSPRPVTIYDWNISEVSEGFDEYPEYDLEVECGRGFYIRSLAHDLGQHVGIGAHLSALRRTMVGNFAITDAVSLDDLIARIRSGLIDEVLLRIDRVFEDLPAAILTSEQVRDIGYGNSVILCPTRAYAKRNVSTKSLRGYGPNGELVALMERDLGLGSWRSIKNFA